MPLIAKNEDDLNLFNISRLDAAGLEDVTLVLNDWCGGQFIISEGRDERVGRLVLAACEAFDNFPPGPAKLLELGARIPGGMWALVALMRSRTFRRLPFGYAAMSRRGIPDDLLHDWFGPARRDKGVRRDFAKFAMGAPDRATLLSWFERMRRFVRPVLVVGAAQDTMMPTAHGPRLAALYPISRLEVVRTALR